MIRWCAYCQTYQGETEPFETFEFSHGICQNCASVGMLENRQGLESIKAIRNLHDRLRSAINQRDRFLFRGAYLDALNLHIEPYNLALSVMQPILYEVGLLWQQGRISVADQHYYSAVSEEALTLIRRSMPELQVYQQSSFPRILLIPARNNRHYFGLLLLEMLLMHHRIPSFCFLAEVDDNTLTEVIARMKPKYLGISVSMAGQIPYLNHVSSLLESHDLKTTTRIIAGGVAFRAAPTHNIAADIRIVQDISTLAAELN